ncbi:sigma-70 region 4 domain-containing protein [Nonomuraea sp. NPDC050202]|uniref:RNA polymerase sigma factor n=1 Tax=Nonomuraea sp. NPDC050202 TaxID=3155035 RepID=UPI0033E57FDB
MDVMHGYTLEDLDCMARRAVRLDYGAMRWRASDVEERYNIAWAAIAEHLAAADECPPWRDLVQKGTAALSRYTDADMRHHGHLSNIRAYVVYWWVTCGPRDTHEERIVERAALPEIMAALTDRQREVLHALAVYEDHGKAAAALGISLATYRARLSRARRHFVALWHEGEEPSRQWGKDVRPDDLSRRPHGGVCARVRHRGALRKPSKEHPSSEME